MKSQGFFKKSLTAVFLAASLMLPVSGALADVVITPDTPASVVSANKAWDGKHGYFYGVGHSLAPQSAENVDVNLVLVIDASYSMSKEEYDIQIDVIADALRSENIHDAWFGVGPDRKTGPIRSIALTVVDFGGWANIRVPWVDFRSDDPNLERRFELFVQQVLALKESRDMKKNCCTQIGDMLNYVKDKVLKNAPWHANFRTVIDVISDGVNGGTPIFGPRRELAQMGVTINALAIENEVSHLRDYFNRELVTQVSDIPYASGLQRGRVWGVARKVTATNNSAETIETFGKEVLRAFHDKIVTETTFNIIPPGAVQHARRESNVSSSGDDVRVAEVHAP